MSDFPVFELESASQQARPALEATQLVFGFITNLPGVVAHTPALTEACLSISGNRPDTD